MLKIPPLESKRGKGSYEGERILVLRRDVAGHSPNFKMELTEKLNYYQPPWEWLIAEPYFRDFQLDCRRVQK